MSRRLAYRCAAGIVSWRGLAAAAAVALATAAHAAAQSGNVPNAVQGFSQNRDQPIKIDAARLEVRDKDKRATFSGNVRLVQGDTTMKCTSLVVFYDQEADKTTAAKGAASSTFAGGQQQVRRLEANGPVTVTQKDQTAIGDKGIFDVKLNTITLTGNVQVTQGPNLLKGERLVVNLTTGVSNVESGKDPRGVTAIITPGSMSKPDAAAAPKEAAKDAKPAPKPKVN
jgi:lipopolysaccharide export system protein LptA